MDTTTDFDARLAALGIVLPTPAAPVADFVPCVRAGDLLLVSGQIPVWNGEIRHVGRVGGDVDVAEARAAARLCALNLLAQARAFLGGDLGRVTRVCQVQGFVNAVPDFGDHPRVIDGASGLLVEAFGREVGSHSRFAVGAGSLPFGVAVEVAATFAVR